MSSQKKLKRRYRWAPRTNAKVSTAKAAAEFERISWAHPFGVSPQIIVAESRAVNAPLHDEFFWGPSKENQKANESWALHLYLSLREVRPRPRSKRDSKRRS